MHRYRRQRLAEWGLRWAVSVLVAAGWSPALPAAPAPPAIEAGQRLEAALEALREGGVPLIYSSRLVRRGMRVEASPSSTSAAEILRQILAPHGLKAVRDEAGNWVVVLDAATPEVAGRVVSQADRSRLPGVRILVLGTDVAAVSGDDGTFRLCGLERGSYVIEARRPGYVVRRLEAVAVTPGRTAEIRFELEPAPLALDEIVVTPSHFALYKSDPESRQFLSRDEVRKLPHLADDLYRAVGWLPGTAHGDTSADFHVRGGEKEEILVLLDGVEIYVPFHLRELNVFSTIDSQAVGGVDFLSGGFPAEYGDRMSGVIDIAGLTPSPERRRSLGVSFVNAGFLGSGTLGDRGQWLLSARRGYLDIVLDIIDESAVDPVYHDLLSQVSYRLGETHELSANVHASYDRVDFLDEEDFEQLDTRETNGYVWLDLTSFWSPRLYSQTIVSHGLFRRDRGGMDDDIGFVAVVDDDERNFDATGVTQHWGRDFGERHFLKAGLEAQRLEADYDYFSRTLLFDPLYTGGEPFLDRIRDLEASASGTVVGLYLADRVRLGDAVALELGGRWDRQTHTDDEQWSPRVNLVWSTGNRPSGHQSLVRLAWGLFHQSQGLHELQIVDGVSEFHPAQRSEHRLIGFEHVVRAGKTPLGGLHFRLELYRKRMTDLRPRFENLFHPNEFLDEIQPDRVRVAPESAEAEGVELVVRQRGGKLGWWASYAWARVEDRIGGVRVPRNWDQRHTFTFSLSAERDKWSFNLAGVYRTGWPTTAVLAEEVALPDGSSRFRKVLGPRNAERFPAYHRLDFRASRELARRRGVWTFFVEVSNVLDRKNVCCLEDHVLFLPPGSDVPVVRAQEDHWLPFLPSFGLSWEF